MLSSFLYLKDLEFKRTNIQIFKFTKLILHAVLHAGKACPAASNKMYNLKCDGSVEHVWTYEAGSDFRRGKNA